MSTDNLFENLWEEEYKFEKITIICFKFGIIFILMFSFDDSKYR